jgi:hypothetical protein
VSPKRTLSEDLEGSPIPSTVDKLWEAWYFILCMVENYHDPHAFRYNLNAFIQALRNITFMLQSEDPKPPGFKAWYEARRKEMASNAQLKRFVEARNLVVKQQMLAAKSTLRIGIFRGRRFKLGVGGEVDHFRDSRELLRAAQGFYTGFMIDEEHSALDEQLGVYREWKVPVLGDGEVVLHCEAALRAMARLIEDAHTLWGTTFDASFELPDVARHQVLLETDVAPDLASKWGWLQDANEA